ncbi:MAG: glycoside hydrolase family 3 N-terminal domain-containing protein [Acidimicrobiales bacterium]|nr:glycoside hydrolase family 3 N-terminal domain-containing protein [Acidimicrobiales bacterium]MDG2219086.1 glycoside hydrolase family 3 N-terminal domain-containing protein [Acidimicrobiales bacterium]
MSSRSAVFVIVGLVVVASVAVIVWQQGAGDDVAAPTTTTTAARITTTSTTTTTTTTTTTIPPEELAVAALLDSMSLREKAEQLVVVGASGDLGSSIDETLGTRCLGGVFVSSNVGNWSAAEDLGAATEAISQIMDGADGCVLPPLVTTDAEAGTRVLKVPVSALPEPTILEANHAADPATTDEGLAPAAAAFARELRDAGVHVNLGVIADVDVGDDYYMASQRRSFGGNPETVAAISAALVEGHCAAGVAATLKHFPNQGATIDDPHRADSVSTNDFAAWQTVGRVPYVDTRAPLVMTGHIRYADVDDGTPATLSTVITTGWLRQDVGYTGVVITDDLHGMRAVADDFSPEQRATDAIAAGADLALYADDVFVASVIDAIVARAESDSWFAARIDRSVERVIRLKGALGLIASIDPAWLPLCGAVE